MGNRTLEALAIYFSIQPKKGYFVAVFNDITKQKEDAANLRRSNERFMTLADHLPEVVFETDITGKLTLR